MSAYYNEHDPFAAAWLRELIKAGHIAPGEVDERSIEDVRPNELAGYTQCHFFAGIGVWSYALRQAGWPDDRPVWTGSCPCQPFSAAGKGKGFTDERHLWPAWFHLIQHGKRPEIPVFGEQVEGKDGLAWLDIVQTDLEAICHTFWPVVLPAAGFGAPHIRHRQFFTAQWLGDTQRAGLERQAGHGNRSGEPERDNAQSRRSVAETSGDGGMADADRDGCSARRETTEAARHGHTIGATRSNVGSGQPGPTNGHWQSADWLYCRDGKWRPTSPFPQPMADGSAKSLGRVCDSRIREFEEEVNATTMETEGKRTEILRGLWRALEAEAKQSWAPGRLPGLHEAPFLLAFLRQLTQQGRGVEECVSLPCEKASQEQLRGMWSNYRVTRSSCERGLEGQQTGEHSDAVRILSSILARHTQEAWGASYQTYAESCFVLTDGAPARVGRLRGYGNAINAEVAKEFIKAAQEVICV